MPIQFAVLASGSSGNATLVQTGGAGTLIDLGIGPRALAHRLECVGASWDGIASAVLTHTHGDHVNDFTLQALARHRIALYCHEGHRPALAARAGFLALDAAGLVRPYDDRPFLSPTGLRIEPVELRHDGPTFGFRIEARSLGRSGRSVAVGYVADTGSWSDPIADALADVDLLGVEFNHDVAMQRRSGRAPALIARNLGDRGHLSNDQGAELISAVLDRSGPGAARHLVLLHLSRQCNESALAVRTACAVVRRHRRRIQVHAALQAGPFPNLWIEPRRRRSAAIRHA